MDLSHRLRRTRRGRYDDQHPAGAQRPVEGRPASQSSRGTDARWCLKSWLGRCVGERGEGERGGGGGGGGGRKREHISSPEMSDERKFTSLEREFTVECLPCITSDLLSISSSQYYKTRLQPAHNGIYYTCSR